MGTIYLKDKTGLNKGFTIAGDTPTASEQERIAQVLNGTPVNTQSAPEPDQTGILSALGQGLASGAYQIGGGLATIAQGIGRVDPRLKVGGKDEQYWIDTRKAANEKAGEFYTPEGGFLDQEGAYAKTRYLANQFGNSAIPTIASIGAIAAAPALGVPLAIAASVPQQLNENATTQEAEFGKIKDWGKLAASTGASAALEGLADRVTLGVAGVAAKAVPAGTKELLAGATKGALATVAKTSAKGAVTGVTTEGLTEVMQQALTRWQAEKPLGGPEAQREYLESAIVGGLLGGTLGGTAGLVGGSFEAKDQAAIKEAMADVNAEKQVLGQASVNAEIAQKNRQQSAMDELLKEEPKPDLLAGLLPSPTRAGSYAAEKAQMIASERGPTPKSSNFSDEEYLKAVDSVRNEKLVSPDMIKNRLKIGRNKATAIFEAMSERKDATAAGSNGQYLSVINKKTSDNVTADTNGRSYEVRPVDSTPQFKVKIKGREIGSETFNSPEEAAQWAEKANVPNFNVEPVTKPETFGVYEVGQAGGKPVNRLVNSYNSPQEAAEAAKTLDPSFSPETNVRKRDAEIASRVDQKMKEAFGPMQKNAQALIDKILGAGRAQVEVEGLIDPTQHGAEKGTVVEGLNYTKNKEGFQKIVLASDIYDPSLSPEARSQKVNEVLTHEAVHAIRNADLLTSKEWDALADHMNRKVPNKKYTWLQLASARNLDTPGVNVQEEGIAEMLRAHFKDPTLLDKDTRSMIDKIIDFIKRMAGFRATEEGKKVISDILSGDIGTREEGSGGLGTRERIYGPYYSSVDIPTFYLKSAKYFESIAEKNPEQTYPAKQWIGMLKNAQIKAEELQWLGIEDWLNQQDGKVPVKNILQYIGANSLDIKERLADGTFAEEDEFYDIENRLQELMTNLSNQFPDLRETYSNDVNLRYQSFAEWIMDNSDLEGTEAQALAQQVIDLQDRYSELYKKKEDARTHHANTTQEGGEDYSELVFHMPHLNGPKFKVQFHYGGLENIISTARFKTRMLDGKKVLAIEEIQSDLHQKGAKNGYRSKGDDILLDQMRQEEDQLYQKLSEASDEQEKLRAVIEDLQSQGINTDSPQYKELMRQFAVAAYQKIEAGKAYNEAADRRRDLQRKASIPDAPFKTTWEQLAIKRLVRYAADHGFDSIAWHAEPEGVRQTERYHNLRTTQDAEGNDVHEVVFEEADETGPEEVQNVTGIVNFYTKKLRNVISKLFKSAEWDAQAPYIYDPRQAAEEKAKSKISREHIEAMFDDYNDFVMGLNAYADAEGDPYINRVVKKAMQIGRNQRNFNAYDALVGADEGALARIVEGVEDIAAQYADPYGYEEELSTRSPDTQRWMFDLSPAMKAKAQEEGFPLFSAVKVNEPYFSATAPMGQRVPLNPPVDRLKEIEDKILYNNMAPVVTKFLTKIPLFKTDTAVIEKNVEGTFIALQDRMLAVGKLVDRIKANGGFISNENDVYLRHQLMSGEVDQRIEDAKREIYNPLVAAVRDLNVTKTDVDSLNAKLGGYQSAVSHILKNYVDPKHALAEIYLYAQHAQERNAEMRKRNDALQADRHVQYDSGSGMTDAESRDILNWFAAQPFYSEFASLGNPKSIRSLFRKVIANTNDTRVNGGLNPDFRTMTREDGTKVDVYEDYAPLRGYLEQNPEHLDEDAQAFARAGKGFKITGKEDFSATGRQDEAANLIGNAILQNQEAIVRAAKNRVAQSFLNMLRDNARTALSMPNGGTQYIQDVAEIIDTTTTKPVYDNKTGTVKMQARSVKMDPDVMVVKEGGKETAIRIKDERLRKALLENSSLGNAGQNALVKGLLKLNRFLASVRTSYNPEFLISNFMRDFGAAQVNLSEYEIKGLRTQIAKDTLPAIKGVFQSLKDNNPNNPWRQAYEEFARRGGKTAFMGIHDLESAITAINTELSQDLSGNWQKSKQVFGGLLNMIERYNESIENGIRVSTYKNLKERFLELSGDPTNPKNIERAMDQAARAAKNLTVNFNMGGDLKPTMNALYLFFNASMQGSAALINPIIRSKKVRRIWLAAIMAGAVQDLLMSAISGEGDDGQKDYDKIRDDILETNMVFLDPFGISERGYFKIPMPYLFNSAYNAGRSTMRALRGGYTPGEAANTIMGTAIGSLNPWGSGGSWVNFVAPTVVDPFVDLAINKNFAGAPIAPPASQFGVDDPAPQRYWNNTSPIPIAIAHTLDRLTGGDGVLEGGISYSPNQYQYMIDFFGGGAMGTVLRAWNAVAPEPVGQGNLYKPIGGEQLDANDVPFIRRFIGNITTKNDQEAYIAKRERVLTVRKALTDARKDGDSERYQEIILKYPEEYRVAAKINAVEARRRKISGMINKIRDTKKIPEGEKKQKIDALKKQRDALVGQGNAIMGDVRG